MALLKPAVPSLAPNLSALRRNSAFALRNPLCTADCSSKLKSGSRDTVCARICVRALLHLPPACLGFRERSHAVRRRGWRAMRGRTLASCVHHTRSIIFSSYFVRDGGHQSAGWKPRSYQRRRGWMNVSKGQPSVLSPSSLALTVASTRSPPGFCPTLWRTLLGCTSHTSGRGKHFVNVTAVYWEWRTHPSNIPKKWVGSISWPSLLTVSLDPAVSSRFGITWRCNRNEIGMGRRRRENDSGAG